MKLIKGFLPIVVLIFTYIISLSSSTERVMLLDTILDDWRGWTTNTGRYSGWRSQNIPPNGDRVFGLCMVMRENNDNWLYSPIIPTGEANSIIIETYFSMRNCRKHPEASKLKSCEEKINMLTSETDEIKELTSQNNKLFKQTAVLFPEKKWSQNELEQPSMNSHKISLLVKTLGVQLGYRDTGSCTMVRRVRVYYLVCPSIVTSFMEFPRTVTKHGYDLAGAQGACVNGAVPKSNGEVQSRFCQSNGAWHELGTETCHCAPGFTPSNDWKSCIPCAKGTHKSTVGADRCSYCPKYSQSELGQVRCHCDNDFYMKDLGSGASKRSICLQLPRAPEQLKANITDGYIVTLTWRYPKSKDTNMLDEIDYFHVSCSNCVMQQLTISPSINVTQQSVTIIGLNMGENYLFFVTAVASILNDSTQQKSNPTRSSVYFSLPKTNGIVMNSAGIVQHENRSLSVFWNGRSGITMDSYMLQICFLLAINNSESRSECEYHFTILNSHLFVLMDACLQVSVRLRFLSNQIWSDYSQETTIKIINQGNRQLKDENRDKGSAESYSVFQWLPNLEVTLLFVTSGILIIILLSVSVILMRRNLYRSMKESDCDILADGTFINNTKSSYASITASSPSKGRSYFLRSSLENSLCQHRVLDEIPSESILLKSLGSKGIFYDVYHACLKQYRKLPLKVTLYVFNTNEEMSKSFLEDAREISQLQHENIVSIIGICSISLPHIIIVENSALGSLNGFLKRHHSSIDHCQLLQFLRDIACALCFLSERKFIVKKLSSHRVYVDDSFVCKLCICLREWNNETHTSTDGRNEIAWRAPELYSQSVHTLQSDVWTFGIVVWEVFSFGEQPYWDWTAEIIKKSVSDGYRLPPSVNCLSVVHDLMLQCWSSDCSQRPTFSLILARLDQAINYVDEKQLTPTMNQLFLLSTDSINQNDFILSSKMLNSLSNSFIQHSVQLSESRRNASMDNITNSNEFHSSKEDVDYLSNKRSHKRFVPNPRANAITSKTCASQTSLYTTPKKIHNNDPKPTRKSATLQRHIKGTNINLSSWLSEINMKKYKRVMMKNGYNNRSKLVNLSIADLTEMGIRKASEIQILINNIQLLKYDKSPRV